MSCAVNDVTDIEDTIVGAEAVGVSRRNKSGIIEIDTKRSRRRSKKGQDELCDVDTEVDAIRDSFVPGSYSIYIKTWGCSHNNSDSEYMAGQLVAAGYKLKNNAHSADIWILNSCTVKTPAEQHVRNYITEANKHGKPIVVTGCVPQAAPATAWLKGLSLLGVQQIDRIVEVVEETLKGNSVRLLAPKKDGRRRVGGADLSLPKIRKNPLIEILAINTGCLNRCTYCKTKQARGDLASYSIDDLVKRAHQSFSEGVKELWLTSEDLGAYGRDIGVTLPELLYELVKIIPDGCMMRLGMTNPPYILDYLEDIACILNHPRVYSFLHIPVQSGSDAVLSDMKREYTRNDFMKVVDVIRTNVPGVTIATDVICGFPTEEQEDFEETASLVETCRFPSLFINQFYPRPGTPAANMKRIDAAEVKRRTKALVELFNSYHPYTDRVGREYVVLVTEESFSGDHYVGHNKAYEQVLLPKLPDIMGKMVKVRIVSSSKYSMVGEILINDVMKQERMVNRVCNCVAKFLPNQLLGSFDFVSRRVELSLMFLVFLIAFLLSCYKLFDVVAVFI